MALILCVAMARAQDSIVSVRYTTIALSLYFPQGTNRIVPAFRGNDGRMRRFERQLTEINKDTTKTLQSISISTGTSPEGISVKNIELSERRAATVADYIDRLLPDSKAVTSVISKGVDWEGLKAAVLSSDMAEKDTITAIIDRVPVWVIKDGRIVDSRKRRLMMLYGGSPWRYMEKHFFPDLRGVSVEVSCRFVELSGSGMGDSLRLRRIPASKYVPAVITVPPIAWSIPLASGARQGYRFGISTNIVYDALFIPNIGLEFPFAVHWSAGLNWMYGWKERHARRPVYAYGGDLHVRYWPGARVKALSGHHFGAYAQMLRYNVRYSGRGYLSDRWSCGAGVEYGYSLALSQRLRIDMSIGLGYLGGICREYVRQDQCDVWQSTKRRRWFGPTKAEISVAWVIGSVKGREGGGG